MPTLNQLLKNNQLWAKQAAEADPHYFERLVNTQKPEYLWIGCSDSRVPANQITNLQPGEIFVHRNIANLVDANDDNCMSVLQFSIDVLKVKHIIVTGHYGCGGIAAAMSGKPVGGCLDQWLQPIREVHQQHLEELRPLDPAKAIDRMCEYNVLEQSRRLSQTDIVKSAWARGQKLEIHSWVYSLQNGLISTLRDAISEPQV
ncbi:carbonic anhydrase [Coraliomargarita sp. W4R53]